MYDIISVVGSPNSGKTSISTKMALEFAKLKKNVMVVYIDDCTPVMNRLFDNKQEGSLGAVLTDVNISQETILQNCYVKKELPYLSFIGYSKNDNETKYPLALKDRINNFLAYANAITDVVIVDCPSNYLKSDISLLAMEISNKIIECVTPDLRGIAWHQSHDDHLFPKYKQKLIPILSNIKENDAIDIAKKIVNSQIEIPYSRELAEQYDCYKILDNISDDANFNFQIQKLVNLKIMENANFKKKG